MNIYHLPSIVKEALPLAATQRNIQAGFKATGIWPFNRDIFDEEDFLSSTVTDRPLPELNKNHDINDSNHESISVINGQQCQPPSSVKHIIGLDDCDPDKPGPSGVRFTQQTGLGLPMNTPNDSSNAPQAVPLIGLHVSPQELRPYPKAGERKGKQRSRKTRKSLILTSTPVKNDLQTEEKEREERLLKKTENAKRKLMKTAKSKMPRKKQKRRSPSSSSSEDEDWSCIECQGIWSERIAGEQWVQCKKCNLWSHFVCASKHMFYICSNCKADEEISLDSDD